MAAEVPNLADVIVAAGAVNGAPDDEALREALDRHQETLPSPGELLGTSAPVGQGINFSIRPGDDADRQVFARYLETGAGAETTIDSRQVTAEEPFRARHYSFVPHKSSPEPHLGRLVFETAFGYSLGEDAGMDGGNVSLMWVVSVALPRLAEFDITETHDGLAVVEWADGVFADSPAQSRPARTPKLVIIEPAPEANAEVEPESEPSRERTVVVEAEPEPEPPLVARDIRISRMSDSLTDGEVESVRNGLGIAKALFEAAAPADRRVAGNFESVKRQADTGDRPVTLAGIPAHVGFASERYITHVGTAGDPKRYSHFDERGSIVTITFNPGNSGDREPEVLRLDLDAEDIVEKIAGLGRRTFIDGEHVDPRLATHQWVGIIHEAAEALNGR